MGVITPKVTSITFGTSHPPGHGTPRDASGGDAKPRPDSAQRGGVPSPAPAVTEAAASVGGPGTAR
jgi:hypothetical protein